MHKEHVNNLWGRISRVNKIYEDRVLGKAKEMGCAKQLVEILKPCVTKGMTVLDVGCGAGYFYHSLTNIGLSYFGVDPTKEYIEIGRRHLPKFGLPPENLQVKGIEEIDGEYDVVVCFSVIQHLPINLKKYLKLLTDCTRQFLVIRSSFHDKNEIIQEYGINKNLPEMKFLNVTYPKSMVEKILKGLSFKSQFFTDAYSGGLPEKRYSNNVLIYPGIYFARRGN